MNKNSEVAMLVFKPLKQKRKNNSFDGNGNVGAMVIKELLERKNIDVTFCSPQTAKNYKIVLVSLTSSYDILSFYKQVHKLCEWKREVRKFHVCCGGFGMQNPTAIREFIDTAVFGRGEGIIEPLVQSILDNKTYEHQSIMRLPDITSVNINQHNNLLDLICYKESFTGCPNKCLFCNYSWSRVSTGNEFGYVQSSLTNNFTSPELTWKQMMLWDNKIGRGRSAIDGFSQRLRFAFGKTITNQDIIDGINHRGSFEGNTVLTVYNIGNMPTENKNDLIELEDVLKKCDPQNRVVVVVHTTPFRPSPATPMQWAEAKLIPSFHKVGGKFFCDRDNLQLCHSRGNESAYSHLQTLVVERATVESDKLFHALATNNKLNGLRKLDAIRAIKKNFDLSSYLRRYDIGDEPTWFLESYTSKKKMWSLWDAGLKKANG